MDSAIEQENGLMDQYLGGLEENDDGEHFGLQVGELLYGIHMHKYISTFQEYNIGLNLFLSLNEEDLSVLGVEEYDVPVILKLINSFQKKPKDHDTIKGEYLQLSPEPKMSMKNILLIQCYTTKQLKQILSMVKIIEKKLIENKFHNTMMDPDYCAARALKIVCTELVRQADILCAESIRLRNEMRKMSQKASPNPRKGTSKCIYAVGLLVATLGPIGVVLWRYLRK